MQEVTRLHRKSLLRRLARQEPDPQETDDAAQAYLWAGGGASDPAGMGKPGLCVCGTTHARVAGDGAAPGRFGSVRLSSEVERQLAQISEATVTRLLRKHRSRKQHLPRKGPTK